MKIKFCVLGMEVAIIAVLAVSLFGRKPSDKSGALKPQVGAFVAGGGMSASDLVKFQSAGSNALVHLIPALATRDTPVQRGYAWLRSKLPAEVGSLLPEPSDSGSARANAAALVGLLGPKAKAAVPYLVSLLRDEAADVNAAISLGAIGPDAASAVPALMEAVTEGRPFAALALGKIGSAAKAARTVLEATSQHGPLWQRHECELALRQINAGPGRGPAGS